MVSLPLSLSSYDFCKKNQLLERERENGDLSEIRMSIDISIHNILAVKLAVIRRFLFLVIYDRISLFNVALPSASRNLLNP